MQSAITLCVLTDVPQKGGSPVMPSALACHFRDVIPIVPCLTMCLFMAEGDPQPTTLAAITVTFGYQLYAPAVPHLLLMQLLKTHGS